MATIAVKKTDGTNGDLFTGVPDALWVQNVEVKDGEYLSLRDTCTVPRDRGVNYKHFDSSVNVVVSFRIMDAYGQIKQSIIITSQSPELIIKWYRICLDKLGFEELKPPFVPIIELKSFMDRIKWLIFGEIPE